MSTNRKTYISFNATPEVGYSGLDNYSDYNVADTKSSKKRLFSTFVGVAALASAFAPSTPNHKSTEECNYIACVADIIEQAQRETSPQALCEALDLYMHKPVWLPAHKYLLGSDLDDDAEYILLPNHEYEVGMQLGTIERGTPPAYVSSEDELEDAAYYI